MHSTHGAEAEKIARVNCLLCSPVSVHVSTTVLGQLTRRCCDGEQTWSDPSVTGAGHGERRGLAMTGLWQCEGVRDCATVVWEVLELSVHD